MAYLIVFRMIIIAKVKKKTFSKPTSDTNLLDKAFVDVVRYVQKRCFDDAVQLLKKHSPDAFDLFLKRLNDSPADIAEMHRVSEL